MSRRAAAVFLVLSSLLLLSGADLTRRLHEDLGRKEPEAAQET
jgi:hypothetical protein